MKRLIFALALVLPSGIANADTLYVAAPPPSAPGHPMNLGADHRASQVGDLVQVVFNFAVNSSLSNSTTSGGSYQLSLTPGTGLASLPLLNLGAGLQSSKALSGSRSQSDTNTFVSQMTATVTGVLPSGALAIAGDQKLIINNQTQMLHITGVVRPDDIDNTDSILSTRVASVEAKFDGNFQSGNPGILKKILNWLF